MDLHGNHLTGLIKTKVLSLDELNSFSLSYALPTGRQNSYGKTENDDEPYFTVSKGTKKQIIR